MRTPFLFAAVLCLPILSSVANPKGFSSPDATIEHADHKLVIQSGSKAVISWDSFSIEKGELVQFLQKDGASYVVNRVAGSSKSELFGELLSNGCVYLINRNGILIGSSAHIQTSGFIASTLDLDGSDLSKGKIRLKGNSEQSVVNEGSISCPAGNIFLIGKSVENKGSLFANQGEVSLLRGADIVIDSEDTSFFLIRNTEEIDQETLFENPYALAIRHSGHIEGREVHLETQAGRCEVQGTIEAPAGKVCILGDAVVISEGASIDTSSNSGGGSILVGGDYQGKNPAVKNAQFTSVAKTAHLHADALESGNGGKVILWADQSNRFYGKISARGGEKSGDGGFVEVSGMHLVYKGSADLRAPKGACGTLLLDPADITISAGSTTAGVDLSVDPATLPSDNTVTINTTDLVNQLQMSNVTIQSADGSGSGPNNGSIVVSDPVGAGDTWSAATKLTLAANSYMQIDADITNTNSGPAFDCIELSSAGSSSGGNPGIAIGTNSIITTVSGNVIVNGIASGSGSSAVQGVVFNSGRIETGTGNISITGNVTGGTGVSHGVLLNGTNCLVSSSGNMELSGQTSSTGSTGLYVLGNWAAVTTGDIIFKDCVGTSTGLQIEGAFSTAGNIFATDNIRASTGFNLPSTCSITTSGNSSKSIQIESLGSTIGALIPGEISTSAGASILLKSQGTLTGLNLSGKCSTIGGAGTISIQGISSSTVIALTGLSLNNAELTSTTGNIILSGQHSKTGTSNTASTALRISGGTITTGGDLIFTDCSYGGATVGAAAVSYNSNAVIGGSIIATNNISVTTSAIGPSSLQFPAFLVAGGTLTCTGDSTKSIQISAYSNKNGSFSHGIQLTGGVIRTTNGAPIILHGTSNINSSASGIILTGAGTRISTADGNGAISLTGIARSAGAGVDIGSGIVSGSGPITINGQNISGGEGHGILIQTTTWDTGTTGTVSLTGSTGGSSSFPIAMGADLITHGPLIYESLAGLLVSTVTITAEGPTSFLASPISVQGSGAATASAGGRNLSVTSTGSLLFSGEVVTRGDTGNGGNVSLSSTAGSVTVLTIDSTGGSASGNGGNISLSASGSYAGGLPTGLIVLKADLIADPGTGGTGGAITLSSNRTSSATVATIVSGLSPGNSISVSGETFEMGMFEAMTALGDISLTANTMTLGDLVALNNLTINATTVNLNLHDSISLLSSSGSFYTSPSLHFFAGGNYTQSGTLAPGALTAKSTPLSQSLLLFGTQILNYDLSNPPSGLTATQQRLVYQLLVADAELSDRLPFQWCALPGFYYLKKGCGRTFAEKEKTNSAIQDHSFEGIP